MMLLALALLAADAPPSRLALTISGGVSLGSYEAGLTWASVRYLRARKAQLSAVTGASAGAVNALLAAALWCEDAAEGRDDGADDNLMHEAWAGLGLEDLLAPAGAGDGLLSAAPVESAVEGVSGLLRNRRFRPGCSLPLGWTVTRDRPEEQNIEGLTARVQRFLVALRFEVDAAGQPRLTAADLPAGSESAADALVLGTTREGVGFDQAAQAILASAAFPLAFRTRELCDCALSCPDADVVSDGTCEGPRTGSRLTGLSCSAPRQLCRRRYVDGGIFDNAPVGLAVDLLAAQTTRQRPFQPATFAVVDPDLRRLEPQGARPSSDPQPPETLLRNLIGTARERELQQTMRAGNWQGNSVRTLADAAQLHAELGDVQQQMVSIAADVPATSIAPQPELFRSPRREALGRFLLQCLTALAKDVRLESPVVGRCAAAMREGRIGEGARLSAPEVVALGDTLARVMGRGAALVEPIMAEIGARGTSVERRLLGSALLLDGSTFVVSSFRFLAGELSTLQDAGLSDSQLSALRSDLLAATEAVRFLRVTEAMLRAFARTVLLEEGVVAMDSARAESLAMLDGPVPDGAPERLVRLAALARRVRGLASRAAAISSNAARLAQGDIAEMRLVVLRRFAPLGSGQLLNFSGFLDRGLRDLDFYIGVYDGVRAIATFNCDSQAPYPAEGRPAPVYRSDAPLELDLAAPDTQRCVGLSMRSIFAELQLARSPRASFVIATLSRIELATLMHSHAEAARLAEEPAWSWLREPPLAAGDPVRGALLAMTSKMVPCEPGAAEPLCLGEPSFDEFLDSLRRAGYAAQSAPMRDALDNRDRWQADLLASLMDRAAAAEMRARTPPGPLVTGVGLGELWSRRARALSSSGAFELDGSTIPHSPLRLLPAVAAHLVPYRVSLDMVRGGGAFSWLELSLRITPHLALQSIADVVAIDDSGRGSSNLGGLAVVRFRDVSFGAGAQVVLPWNGEPVPAAQPVVRLGWLQDRLALTGRLRSASGRRQAAVTLSVADLNGLAYWLGLWAAGR